MPSDARAAVERAARELLAALAGLPPPAGGVRVADAAGELACLIQVWPAGGAMPTLASARPPADERAVCRADILEVVAKVGRALIRKEVVQALRAAGRAHGPGTVAKALAELTRSGELVNPQDKRGYRLAAWRRDKTPSLFD